jgi:HAD superfamily hydrolase (TIGR01509 family)
MPVRAVLFDLDGTLVDSERESAEAMARVLQRDAGLPVTEEQRLCVVGHSWNEIYPLLKRDYGAALTWSQEELVSRTARERVNVIAELGMTVLPGAREALARLGGRWPTALVTGSGREEAAQALAIVNADHKFEVIVASEDVTRGKPSPDPYLQAARHLGVPPSGCVVLEDSVPGITAGRAAGMIVIAIKAGNFLGVDQSQAHRIVATLDDITIELLEELVEVAA